MKEAYEAPVMELVEFAEDEIWTSTPPSHPAE